MGDLEGWNARGAGGGFEQQGVGPSRAVGADLEMEVVIAETMKLFDMTRGEVFEVLGKITRDEA